MNKTIKYLLYIGLLASISLTLFWFYSPASVGVWFLHSSPIANLTIERFEALSTNELLLTNLRYREMGLGLIELAQLRVSLDPWPLAYGESPINEIVITNGGSFTRLPGKAASSSQDLSISIPFRRLRLTEPGLMLNSAPKLIVTSAELKPLADGKIGINGSLKTLAGAGSFSGKLFPDLNKADFEIEANNLPCGALASMVTSEAVAGLLSVNSQLIFTKSKEGWHCLPNGTARISELRIGSWFHKGYLTVAGSSDRFQVTSLGAQLDLPYFKSIETTGSVVVDKEKAHVKGRSKFFDLSATFSHKTSSPLELIERLLQKEALYALEVNLDELPLTHFQDFDQIAKVKDGNASGSFQLRGHLGQRPEVSGTLNLKELSLQSSAASLHSVSMSLSTTREQLTAVVDKGVFLLHGLPLMGVQAKANLSEKEFRVNNLQLKSNDGLDLRGSFAFHGIPPYETNALKSVSLTINKLPVGPKLIFAPKLLGTPLAGLVDFHINLNHPQSDPIENSTAKLGLSFASYPGAVLPLKIELSAEQSNDKGSFALDLLDPKSNSSIAINGSHSQGKMNISSFPLHLFNLPVDRTSLDVSFSWPTPTGSYPFAQLYNHPPEFFELQVLSGKAIGLNGKELLTAPHKATLKIWPKEKRAQGELPLLLLEQGLALEFSKDQSTPFVLKCDNLQLASLWKELFPADYFFKPLGRLSLRVAGPAALSGEVKLYDGGLEYWQKSEGIIRCLKVTLPKLALSIGGALLSPSLSSDKLSFSVSNGQINFVTDELPIHWEEKAPLANKILRKGYVVVDGSLKGKEGNLTLGGWSERRKKDDSFAHLSIKGDIEKKEGGEESIVLDVQDKAGGSGLLTAHTKKSLLFANIKTNGLSLGHLPGYASLDDVSLDFDSSLNMHLAGGFYLTAQKIEQNGVAELANLLRRNGQLKVKTLALRGTNLEISVNKPFAAKFSGTGVELSSFAATLANQTIKASGSFDPYGKCSLSLETDKVPLAGLLTLVGLTNLDVDGFLTAQLGLNGTMPFPDLEGSLSLQGGRLRIPYLAESLTLKSLQLQSKGPTTIVSATGLMWGTTQLELVGKQQEGSTTVTLAGQGLSCTIGQTRIPSIDLDSKILIPQVGLPKVSIGVKGNQGTTIHLPSSIPATKSTTDDQFERLMALLSSIEGEMKIELPPRLRLVNQFIDAEVRGECSFKTKPTMNLSIKLQLVGGEVTLHRRSFVLQQGALTIAGHPRDPRTTMAIRAKTNVGNYTIELSASGSLDEPQVALSSIPALSEESIIALLTMGIVPLSSTADVRNEMTASARDYLVTSALSDYLLANLNIRDVTLRSTTEGSFLRMRKYLGRRLKVDVEQAIQQQETGKARELSFELGLDKNLFLEGRRTSGEDVKSNDNYFGFFRTFRFR